jgi:hypothetical protein
VLSVSRAAVGKEQYQTLTMPETVLQISQPGKGEYHDSCYGSDQANIPMLIMSEGEQKQPRQRRPGVRFEQTQKCESNSHAQSTKYRQSDVLVDDINDRPKKDSRVR